MPETRRGPGRTPNQETKLTPAIIKRYLLHRRQQQMDVRTLCSSHGIQAAVKRQRTPQWFALRFGMLGGSTAAQINGNGTNKWKALLSILQCGEPKKQSRYMRLGLICDRDVLLAWATKNNIPHHWFSYPPAWFSDCDYVVCSPDAILTLYNDDGTVRETIMCEVKTTWTAAGLQEKRPPQGSQHQVRLNKWATGCARAVTIVWRTLIGETDDIPPITPEAIHDYWMPDPADPVKASAEPELLVTLLSQTQDFYNQYLSWIHSPDQLLPVELQSEGVLTVLDHCVNTIYSHCHRPTMLQHFPQLFASPS
jgi:hypothetical protein